LPRKFKNIGKDANHLSEDSRDLPKVKGLEAPRTVREVYRFTDVPTVYMLKP
jgi:hypothetical protein